MSNEQSNPMDAKVHVVISKDENVDALREELAEKDAMLEQISAIEFSKQCQQYNLDPAIATPSDLERAKLEAKMTKNAPKGSSPNETPYLYPERERNTIQLDSETDFTALDFSSEQEMIETLNVAKAHGSKQASELLGKLAKKALNSDKSQEFEFDGKITMLNHQPYRINPLDTDEIGRKKEEYNAKLKANNSWKALRDI